MKIYVLNGPNLDMLGQRDADQYGTVTLDAIERRLTHKYPNIDFAFFQSNHEGLLVESVHELVGPTDYAGLVANFGAYTHTSIALRDALTMVAIPKIEVHLSNIHAREEFRAESVTGVECDGIITGLGADSYVLAVQAILSRVEEG